MMTLALRDGSIRFVREGDGCRAQRAIALELDIEEELVGLSDRATTRSSASFRDPDETLLVTPKGESWHPLVSGTWAMGWSLLCARQRARHGERQKGIQAWPCQDAQTRHLTRCAIASVAPGGGTAIEVTAPIARHRKREQLRRKAPYIDRRRPRCIIHAMASQILDDTDDHRACRIRRPMEWNFSSFGFRKLGLLFSACPCRAGMGWI